MKIFILLIFIILTVILQPTKATNNQITTILSNQTTQPNNQTQCTKDQLTALLLSIFVGSLGVDRFYLGYNDLGAGKIVLTLGSQVFLVVIIVGALLIYACGFVSPMIGEMMSENTLETCCCVNRVVQTVMASTVLIIGIIIYLLANLGVSAWWIADLVMIATGEIKPNHPYCYNRTI